MERGPGRCGPRGPLPALHGAMEGRQRARGRDDNEGAARDVPAATEAGEEAVLAQRDGPLNYFESPWRIGFKSRRLERRRAPAARSSGLERRPCGKKAVRTPTPAAPRRSTGESETQ